MHLLVFTVDDQRFALPVSSVHETIAAVAVTSLPSAPAVVDGVIDVRGTVIPGYDLRVRIGRDPQPVRAAEHFIIADAGKRQGASRGDSALEMVVAAGLHGSTKDADDSR